MKVQCHRCKHIWNYKGEKLEVVNKYMQFITCPRCRTTTKLKEPKE